MITEGFQMSGEDVLNAEENEIQTETLPKER